MMSSVLLNTVFNVVVMVFNFLSKAMALLQNEKKKLIQVNKALEQRLKNTTQQMTGEVRLKCI